MVRADVASAISDRWNQRFECTRKGAKEIAMEIIEVNVVSSDLSAAQVQKLRDVIESLKRAINDDKTHTLYTTSWELYRAYIDLSKVYREVLDAVKVDGEIL